MSASTFKILKQCLMCGNRFEAQKVSTLYCSHKCNSRHYKLKLKLAKKEEAETAFIQPALFKPKVNALSRAQIMDKVFISVKELALLFNCSTKTIYAMIKAGIVPAKRLTERKILIRIGDIDNIFDTQKQIKQ